MEGKPWCYVQGAQNCKQAGASVVAGEAKTWRQCSPCNCQDAWSWKGARYSGCAKTPEYQKTWCYVQGGESCIQAQNITSIPNEPKKWRNCQACNCMDAWNYKGVAYEGCATTPNFKESTWCYVQGGGNSCIQGQASEEPGEKKKWRTCGVCNCMSEWNYKEQGNPTAKSITYQGCATTPGFAGKWCYVNGHQNCKVAKPSLDKAEPKFWRKCFQCSCMDSWNYKGTQYKGCTVPPGTTYTKPWCYVQGGPGCSQAQDSEEKGEEKKWMDCKPCACQENWEYKGQSYKACSKTPNTDYNWCYVIGQTLTDCPAAQDSLLMASEGEQRKWRKCGDSKGT